MKTSRTTSRLRWLYARGHNPIIPLALSGCKGDTRLYRSPLSNERGVALIVTLFVVALVTVLVLEYNFDATVELDLATNYSEDVQAYHLAMAGINFARAVLQQDDDSADGAGDLWFQVESFGCVPPQGLLGVRAMTGENGLLSTSGMPSAPTPAREPDGSTEEEDAAQHDAGCVSLRIIDEARKLPINALQPAMGEADPDPIWKDIFVKFFEGFGMAEDTIEALVDWLDTDDETRASGGAENSYYEGLKTPYKAHNGPMFSTGELRIVRGFTAETIAKLFPGAVEAAVADLDLGNNPYLTSYGGGTAQPLQPGLGGGGPQPQGRSVRGTNQPQKNQEQQEQQEQREVSGTGGGPGNPGAAKVNLNTAEPEVLQILFAALEQKSLDSMSSSVTDFINERQRKREAYEHFKDLNEALSFIPDGAPNGLSDVVDVKSTHFRVEATGKVGELAIRDRDNDSRADIRPGVVKKAIAIFERAGNTVKMISFKIE